MWGAEVKREEIVYRDVNASLTTDIYFTPWTIPMQCFVRVKFYSSEMLWVRLKKEK